MFSILNVCSRFFFFTLSMANCSTAKKGDITIEKNVACNLVEQSTGRMEEGRSGGGGSHQE